MKLRLTFGHTADESFLVTTGLPVSRGGRNQSPFCVTAYDHEDVFLSRVMSLDLAERELFDTVLAVLLTINKPIFPQRWVDVHLDPGQIRALGLQTGGLGLQTDAGRAEGDAAWRDLGEQHRTRLHDFFMHAPLPLVILLGPEHRFSLINPPYLSLLRREDAGSVLGKPVREALPELKGQPFFRLLDTVYQTGVPFIGREVPGRLLKESNGVYEDVIFDFIYHPIRDAEGRVEGIMVQAKDVTDEVLARQVSAAREAKLFRQWTELEAIYRTAPVALSLMDAKDFRFLRANQRAAEMLGCSVEEILGKPSLVVLADVVGAREVLAAAARGETIVDLEMEGVLATSPEVHRYWTVSLTPVFDASGQVSAITSAMTETTSLKRAEMRLLEAEKALAMEMVAESFGRQVASPLEDLQAMLDVVRGEIRRPEAIMALELATEELRRIAYFATEIAQRYGLEGASAGEEVGAGR